MHASTATQRSCAEWVPGRTIDARYRLASRIEGTVLGDAWRAVELRGGCRSVRIIRLGPSESFDEVGFAACARDHRAIEGDGVVPILAHGVASSHPFVVTDVRDDVSLAEWITREKGSHRALGLDAIWHLFDSVARGVARLHEARRGPRVHGCITPSSIFVSSSPCARLEGRVADSGFAAFDDVSIRRRNAASSAARYAAPEQVLGVGESAASDVYALALVVLELVALPHALPIASDGRLAIVVESLEARAGSPVARVLAAALAEDPAARPPNAEALRSALRAAWLDAPAPSNSETRDGANDTIPDLVAPAPEPSEARHDIATQLALACPPSANPFARSRTSTFPAERFDALLRSAASRAAFASTDRFPAAPSASETPLADRVRMALLVLVTFVPVACGALAAVLATR